MVCPHRFLCQAVLLSSAAAVRSTVDLGYATYRGASLSSGVSQWLGMRFARPPLGDLRFAPPQDPLAEYGVQDATEKKLHCAGTGNLPSDIGKSQSEDCLFINVMAPTNASEFSKLPVYLYLQGGGFNTNSDPDVNGTGLIQAADYDMILVDFNYRVGPYGFLTDGRHVVTNNGLRDQRKAMEWVQHHIRKFGGDPDRVVIGGTSAGAASVSLHLSAYNGWDFHLFRGAIAEEPSYATTLTVDESYYQYKQFATRLGCVGPDNLACLRRKTTQEIQQENYNIPFPGGANPPEYMWEPVIDGELVPDYTVKLFEQGRFLRVPTIFGDDSNGGTKFTPKNTTTLAQSNQYILDQYPFLTLDNLGELNELYPNPNATACPGVGCYWRQVSNVYQEARYMCPGLGAAASMSRVGVRGSYAYRWDVEDPAQEASGLGVPHTVELGALLGPAYSDKAVPESYKPGGINAAASPVIQAYWTSFVRTLDPNKYRHPGSARWETWRERPQARLRFGIGGNTTMEELDPGLRRRCEFWERNGVALRL